MVPTPSPPLHLVLCLPSCIQVLKTNGAQQHLNDFIAKSCIVQNLSDLCQIVLFQDFVVLTLEKQLTLTHCDTCSLTLVFSSGPNDFFSTPTLHITCFMSAGVTQYTICLYQHLGTQMCCCCANVRVQLNLSYS